MHRIPTTDLGFAREQTFNGTFDDINGISQLTMSHVGCRRPFNTPFAIPGVALVAQAWGFWGPWRHRKHSQLDRNFHAYPSTSLNHSHRPAYPAKSAIRNSSKPLEIQTFHLLTSKGLVKQNFHPRMTHENHLTLQPLVIKCALVTSK
jgi:hypothetical protein